MKLVDSDGGVDVAAAGKLRVGDIVRINSSLPAPILKDAVGVVARLEYWSDNHAYRWVQVKFPLTAPMWFYQSSLTKVGRVYG